MPSTPKDPRFDIEYVRLLTLHQSDLRAYIVSLIPGSSAADDALQESNLVLWEKRSRFELGTNFLAWAFTVTRYEVLKQRELLKNDRTIVFSDELGALLAEESQDDGAKPVLQALQHCLSILSPAEREIIDARYTKGSSLQQLSADKGQTPESLRAKLYRLRAALRRCVEQQLDQSGEELHV